MDKKNSKWLFTGILVVVLSIGIVGAALAQDISYVQANSSHFTDKIETELITSLSAGSADFIVRFNEQADLSLAYQMAWKERGAYVYNSLRDTAQQSQLQAKNILDSMSIRYQTFIAGDELYVWGGSLGAAQSLAALPEVENIRATQVYHIEPIVQVNLLKNITWAGDYLLYPHGPESPNPDADYDWGILDTQANQFWSTFGFQGEGIVVSNIDTGVQWDHEALINQYRCKDNPTDPSCWYDPSDICLGSVCDNVGHGTHTMGTMVADDNPDLPYIAGMAPNAQWIACKGCEYNSCSDYALNTCADWILAPGGDPANRPNIVNNSWGGGGCNTWYLDKVNAWRAAGTFPAFSAGNNYDCNSLGSPGDYQESFGSTSHNVYRDISYFSSKGPSCFGHDPYTKPNLSAPGENICSTVPYGWDCGYSGTSMASPHSAGAVALLWSCNPSLVGQIDQTFQILQDNADTPPEGYCGAPEDGEGNYTFGYGYLDIFAAGMLWCGGTGTLEGIVTDLNTSNPIPYAHVFTASGPYETTTDENGFYHLTMMVDTYDVTAEAYGYFSTSAIVEIVTDTVTIQDFYLEPKPSWTISGIVTDSLTGWPLYAYVAIAGYPPGGVWSDPVTGYYSVSLPEGDIYDFTVSAIGPGYLSSFRTVGPLFGNLIENFTLEADLVSCNALGYKFLPYREDFEADNGNFSTYGFGYGADSWEWGNPSSPYPGPAPSGVNVWGTNLDGNYNDSEDSYLESPDIDLSSLVDQWFDFSWWQWLQTEWWNDFVEIQVSNDGGQNWTIVYGPTSGDVDFQWTKHSFMLDPTFAVGNFRLRFHIYSNDWYTYPGWYLDDLSIGTCQPEEGGLVVGNVYDTNLGMPLTGAQVSNDIGDTTLTAATSDPAVSDSFYMLFSPLGWHDFTASFPGYNTITEPVSVTHGTVGHDFYLPAGMLVTDPTSLEAELLLGETQTAPLNLSNIGDGSAFFQFKEIDKGFIPTIASMPAPEPNGEAKSSNNPETFSPKPSTPHRQNGADVLLIQDYDPWGYPSITTILNNNAIPYDLINSYQIWEWDFSPYVMIIIPSVQGWDYYNNFNSYVYKFEEYIDSGGLLLMSFCTYGESVNIPFGGTNPWDPQDYDTILEPDYPIFAGVPNPIFGTSASHNSFSGVLPDDRLLMTTGSYPGGNPLLIEREHGEGMVVAGGLTYEFGWWNGQDAGMILNNMISYYYFVWVDRDVPWISEVPISGTIPAESSQLIEVTFDASLLAQPGTYLADLEVQNDTPYGSLMIPVTMTVTPPPDWGKLQGTVVSLGYCDQAWDPLAEAQVVIQSSLGESWTLETDAGGYFSWWLAEGGNPYSVSVTYPDHEPGMVTDVIIVGQQTITQDFALRWLQPCVQSAPPSLETTLELGLNDTLPMTLTNTGAAGTDFTLSERDGGWVPTSFNSVVVPAYQLSGNGVDTYAGQQLTTRDAFTYQLPAGVRLAANDIRVLLVAAADVYQLQAMLQAYPDLIVVDYYDARNGTPTLDELLAYDNVVLSSNNYFYDPYAMGNVLADYVDAGGTVVQTVPTFYGGGWSLSGRFVDEGYSPFIASGDWWTWADLDDFDPAHPIMEGVSYAGDTARQVMDMAADAEWVADWTDDEFIATKGKVVALNTALFDGYYWSGDIPLIVHNSIAWLMSGGDVLWLTEVPITGTLPADVGLQPITVSFDSAMVSQPGTYNATLSVKTDDPVNPKLPVAVTMNVSAPADWGKLTGIVESLGACDLNPAPLSEYTVVVDISGTPLTATLSEDGSYTIWLEQGTYTVTASADGHVSASSTAEIIGGEVTPLDFGLRWIAPCISGTPTSYNVEVPQGFSFNFPFDVVNTGAGEGSFKLRDRSVTEIYISSGTFASPQTLVPIEQQQARSTEGINLPAQPTAPILEAGDLLQSWSPSSNSSPWGISYDGADETTWVGEGWGSPYIYEYQPNGTPTGRS